MDLVPAGAISVDLDVLFPTLGNGLFLGSAVVAFLLPGRLRGDVSSITMASTITNPQNIASAGNNRGGCRLGSPSEYLARGIRGEVDAFATAGSGRRTVHGQSDAAGDQRGRTDGEGGLLYKAPPREVVGRGRGHDDF